MPGCRREVTGEIRKADDGLWFRLGGVDGMAPFLMTLASDSDHWLFLLSNGGLTAGRGNPDRALFPYYTQDKLLDLAERSGSSTLIRAQRDGGAPVVWAPFTRSADWDDRITRNLEKNELGNHIILEEVHAGLGLSCRLSWRPSGRFGFVRRLELFNMAPASCRLELLDGLLNLLPAGLTQRFQNEFSILGDAYKQVELVEPGNLAVVHLSSVPTDLAEPMEALLGTVAWQVGMPAPTVLLTETQAAQFRMTGRVAAESSSRGRRAAFLNACTLDLAACEGTSWYVCADVFQDRRQVEELQAVLSGGEPLQELIETDCRQTEERLRRMVAQADGLQRTQLARRTMRHTSNTLFNLMRGGAFITGYTLPRGDLIRTVAHFNPEAAASLESLLPPGAGPDCLEPWQPGALQRHSRDALRLLREYLPLTFSRRHGDPSRPWNRFSIDIREADGSPRFSYQGNWRDIFQNWEALLQAWPEYTEAAICRFLNASTADGYNPYRVTKQGFEWETLDPHDSWANIGYWGDHQIIYLLRLLETSVKFHPDRLDGLLAEETFVYAEVPYRIRGYDEILRNPRATVDYDGEWETRIKARVARAGADGKLMQADGGGPLYVSLLEKLLTPLLAKLSNFIPGGGIWMNTQRPEWNDANNALVGFGVSVVTLGYIARYLRFLTGTFGERLKADRFHLSGEVAAFLTAQHDLFGGQPGPCTDAARRDLMDQLGRAAGAFREALYAGGLSGSKTAVSGSSILAFLERALAHTESSLRENRRADELWHSYNLLRFLPDGVGIDRLGIMLEGQVSILSSGLLGVDETLGLLAALRRSPLYRADQDSYLLYPDRPMPGFLDKNSVDARSVESIAVLRQMLQSGDSRIVTRLPSGDIAFNGHFHNSRDLEGALAQACPDTPREEVARVLDLFENTFNHRAFTGRSGTFFAYEGLGSIYWHMVSKLVLAVQEAHFRFQGTCPADQLDHLAGWYRAIRNGLGVDKNPALYGAFPTDAYSHTPAHCGAQQPGMTGQVKEDILIRLAELGICIEDGRIRFRPNLLEAAEFLQQPDSLTLPVMDGGTTTLLLDPGTLAYTYCQVPVVYHQGAGCDRVRVFLAGGDPLLIEGLDLPHDLSREIFQRTGRVSRIEVELASRGAAS